MRAGGSYEGLRQRPVRADAWGRLHARDVGGVPGSGPRVGGGLHRAQHPGHVQRERTQGPHLVSSLKTRVGTGGK